MVQIYNSDLMNELRDGAKIQQNRDIIPNQLADKVVPVMEVNPKLLRNCNIVLTLVSTATGSIASGNPGGASKIFYLDAISIGIAKDATCDAATGTVSISGTAYETNATVTIISVPILTLTAQNTFVTLSFPTPIKIAKNTQFSMTGAFTVGLMSRTYTLYGHTDDSPNA